MLARLLMVLVLAVMSLPQGASAVPMAAGCHEAIVPMHHQAPVPATAAEHACIGCIPPGDWLGARIAVPVLARAMAPEETVSRLDLGSATPPALPPPRMA